MGDEHTTPAARDGGRRVRDAAHAGRVALSVTFRAIFGHRPLRAGMVSRPPTPEEIGFAVAACWLCEGRQTDVAALLGVSDRTLRRWQRRADFRAAYKAVDLVWTHEFRRRSDETDRAVRAAQQRLHDYYTSKRRRRPCRCRPCLGHRGTC